MLALAVIAVWLVLLVTGFVAVLVSRIDRQVDDTLRVRAQAATATVTVRAGRIVGSRESATDGALDSSIWIYAGSRAVVRPPSGGRLSADADALATAPTGFSGRSEHRFYVLPVRLGGRRIGSVVAALSLEPYERTKHVIEIGSVVTTLLLLLGAYPVLRLATGRALRPVDEMTRQAAEWSVVAPGARFGTGQRYAELGSLAGTLDELLDRLAAVLRHERHLSAELSHELRTPLSRVSAQVDLALEDAEDAGAEQRVELEAIRESCRQMDGIIDTLLAAARSDFASSVGRCALSPVFDGLADGPRPPVVRAEPTGLTVGVDADLVERMLAPIVANARRYAVAEIRLTAAREAEGVCVRVSNDGPRLAPGLEERVFEPGFRADPEGGHDGAGLGLSLARRLARAADGDLVVDHAAPRTTFRLRLPAG